MKRCSTPCPLKFLDAAEEAEHRRRRRHLPLAEFAVEAGVGDEAAPRLGDESGADEAPGIVGREPEEDLFHHIHYRKIVNLLSRLPTYLQRF
jgi:hypothetical protein